MINITKFLMKILNEVQFVLQICCALVGSQIIKVEEKNRRCNLKILIRKIDFKEAEGFYGTHHLHSS